MTLPLVALAVAATVALVRSSEPEYSANGAVVLLRTGTVEIEVEVPVAPEAATPDADVTTDQEDAPADDQGAAPPEGDDVTITIEDVPLNPYEQFSVSVGVAATLLEEVGSSREFRSELARNGLSTDFTVQLDGDAPILLIEATARRPETAIATVVGVAEALESDLDARQSRFDAPAEARIITDDVVVPTQATRVDSARNRALVAIVILTFIVVAGAAMIVDELARSRARRRAARRLDAALVGGADVGDDGGDVDDDEDVDAVDAEDVGAESMAVGSSSNDRAAVVSDADAWLGDLLSGRGERPATAGAADDAVLEETE